MSSYAILITGLTLSFLMLFFELRVYHASDFKYKIYKLCNAGSNISGEDYYELYNKLPSTFKMVLSFKSFRLDRWYDEEDLEKFDKILNNF